MQYQWRSRDNRKGKGTPSLHHSLPSQLTTRLIAGRHALVVYVDDDDVEAPTTSSLRAVAKGIGRMFTTFPYWDVSFLVAFFFTIGCAAFIIDGFFYWLPLVDPSTEFPHETTTAGGLAAFIGATLFQLGAVLLVVEAVNANQTGCFGWALEQTLTHDSEEKHHHSSGRVMRCTPNPHKCAHHHRDKHNLVKDPASSGPSSSNRRWEWWPTWTELWTHYFHELGFVANFSLFVGATVFYVSGVLDIPGVYDHLPQGVLWGVYWLTYLVGGVIFVVASALYMLEVQPNWYTPAPHLLGWHIGVWNLIGSIGWTLSASLGYCSASWCSYQSNLSLLWASTAYMIGSVLLWYEALDKYPVERRKRKKS